VPSGTSARRSGKSPEPFATPLVVGVTGHRDLPLSDLAALEREVDRFLEALQERTPHGSVTVMCGMAEGADTLVATRALRHRMSVRAVLPMPLRLYEDDFGEAGRRELIDTLEDSRIETVELGLPPGLSESEIEAPGPARDRLYESLADQILISSNVLLALWDGKVTGLLGGTSDVVLRHLSAANGFGDAGRIEPMQDYDSISQPSDPAYVYWIPTRRRLDGMPTDRPSFAAADNGAEADGSCFLVGGEGGTVSQIRRMPKDLAEHLTELDEYNALHARLSSEGDLAESEALLAGAPIDPEDPYRPALERIDREYVRSDSLAVHFQGRSDLLFNLSAVIAGTMGVVFLLFAKIVSSTWLLVIYLALFGIGLLAFRLARRRRWLSRHLTYRALAETMRTRFYLVVAGAHRSVDVHELMVTTGTHRLPGFALIDGIVRATEPPMAGRRDRSEAAKTVEVDYVHSEWVGDQAAYFRSKIDSLAHSQHRIDRVKLLLVGIFVAATVVLIFAKDPLSTSTIYEFSAEGAKKADEPVSVKTLLIFVMGALPFLLGVWELHNNKLATKELLWQYRNQADYFSAAERELTAIEDIEGRRDVIARLGRKSLAEGYQWAMYRFHREHEPPVAG
jgi:hypothetical protein